MNKEFKHLPAIILINKARRSYGQTKKRLHASRFRTCEAVSVFDALESISDFTLRDSPDVVLLDVDSVKDDFNLLTEILLHSAGGEMEFPVFALRDANARTENADLIEGDIAQIEAMLEEIVPYRKGRGPAFSAAGV